MKISIPALPPSANHMYHRYKNGVVKTKEYRDFEQLVASIVKSKALFTKPLIVKIDLYSNWYTKKGTIRKVDAANYEKCLIDSVFKCLDIDDALIWRITLEKKQSQANQCDIEILDF